MPRFPLLLALTSLLLSPVSTGRAGSSNASPPALVAQAQDDFAGLMDQAAAQGAAGRAGQAGALYLRAAEAATGAGRYGPAEAAYQKAADAFHLAGDADNEALAYEKLAAAYELEAGAPAAPTTQPAVAPAGTAVKPLAVPTPARNAPPAAGQANPKPAPPKANAAAVPLRLPALAPRPGFVIGRAVFEDGRPVPRFSVEALGYDGQVNLFPRSTPLLGAANGANGRYAFPTLDTFRHVTPVDGLVVAVNAYAQIDFNGRRYEIQLRPLDGLPDGSEPGGFKRPSGKGVVRDFVLKISAGRVDVDLTLSQGRYPVIEDASSLSRAFPAGSSVEVTFTPTGPLLDGSRGSVVVRSFPLAENWQARSLRGIPLGVYAVSARLTPPGGEPRPLRLSAKPGDPWRPQVQVDFPPSKFVPDGSSAITLYLGQ